MVATRSAANGQAEIKRVPLFRVSTQVQSALPTPLPLHALARLLLAVLACMHEGFHGVPRVNSQPLRCSISAQESLDSPIDRRSDYYRQKALLQQFKSGTLQPQPLLTPPNV